ncbi:glycoside hydrolase family 36 protein [Paenibacillus sepulcri]|uniref:Alpha-galactosidase n=1 Tax=Paenibacillus sepulcri TaxID=359917 RepID=A0ABS7BZ28_9BACL|nr:alpha-galactosidase [Paenibacillus sepulcri]
MKSLINKHDPVVTVSSEISSFKSFVEVKTIEEDVFEIHIRLTAGRKQVPPIHHIRWSHPAIDIHSLWHPGTDRNKAFQVDWGEGFQSKNTSLAPAACLYNLEGRSRLTFAFSDALNHLAIKAGIHEEDATFLCSITLFEEPMPEIDHYEAVLRIDRRDLPYYVTLRDVSKWWETFPEFLPANVPEAALQPMYSTWYSFHQELSASELERQSELARSIGCESIIVDDGWQTDDNNRGYAYTGDWEVCAEKIPDMRKHVDAVHEQGMNYMLWYSVPFVGINSRTWSRFEGKYLGINEKLNASVLDPRFPEVREYLINIYEQAVKEWNIDGLKLDFVDSFQLSPDMKDELGNGRDYHSVPEAVDRLLTDVMARLREIKPDILIEFRQTYIGPLMRKYGNMLRANDCPNDSIQNRIRTMDIRLLSGNTAVHSDMIMFHANEPVESAAMQLINVLFSVPQISVRLDEIGPHHLDMLRFWLAFCKEHRELLLKGELLPQGPELMYPLISARDRSSQITAVYADMVVEVHDEWDRLIIVNGTYHDRLAVRSGLDHVLYHVVTRDCRGQIVQSYELDLHKGLHEVSVPRAGVVSFQRVLTFPPKSP